MTQPRRKPIKDRQGHTTRAPKPSSAKTSKGTKSRQGHRAPVRTIGIITVSRPGKKVAPRKKMKPVTGSLTGRKKRKPSR